MSFLSQTANLTAMTQQQGIKNITFLCHHSHSFQICCHPCQSCRPPSIYVGSPGYDGSPACGKTEYAPEGKASADIVTEFAENHDIWQETFWDAWEKMQMNGYDNLFVGPNDWHLKNYT